MSLFRLLNHFGRRRDRLEHDLDRELRYHLDRRVEDLIKEGCSEPEARRRASLELGGVPQVQEAVRDTWTWRWLDALVRDVGYAMRSLARSWGFTLGVGAVLALAIGASVAMFSVVSTVLLQPLPYPDAERIVSIETLFTNTGQSSQMVSAPDFLDWQERNDVFETMAVVSVESDFATIVSGRAMFSNARFVSADFFAVFGQTPSAGRLPMAPDVRAGGVAVLAHPWAVTQFGSPEAAIGETVVLYGEPLEVVGVAAPGFRYPGDADLWAPFSSSPNAQRERPCLPGGGEAGAGHPDHAGGCAMRTIADSLAEQHPENRVKTVALLPLQERLTGSVRLTLWILMSAVAVVWLIACANIANLLLARAASRTREIALRAALGAGRGRVVRQLLTESGVLAGAAGLAGVVLAALLVQAVVAWSPADLPRISDVRIDARHCSSRLASR